MSATQLLNPFKVFETTERETIGTVASLIPNGKLKLIPGTINRYNEGTNVAIGVILIDKDGASTTLPCSKKVSKNVVNALENGTKKTDALIFIAKLEVCQYQNNKTHEIQQTISAPVGENGEEEEVDINVVPKTVATWADLG